MDAQKFNKYKERLCGIIMEKIRKYQFPYQCLFSIVEIVNNQCIFVTNIKESWLKIPVEPIRGINANEGQRRKLV